MSADFLECFRNKGVTKSNTHWTLFDACHPTALPQFVTPHASRSLNLKQCAKWKGRGSDVDTAT